MTAKYAVMEINSTCELLKAQCSVTQKSKFLTIMSKRTFGVLKKNNNWETQPGCLSSIKTLTAD